METQNKPTALQVPLQIDLSTNNEDNISRDLQITSEREDELDDIFNKAWHKHSSVTAIMAEVSGQVKTAAELAYICFHLGVRVNKARQMEGMASALKKMLGGND